MSLGAISQLTQEDLIIYPITLDKAIYDEEGNRLDTILTDIKEEVTNATTQVTNSVTEAPKDSKNYIRNNGSWVELTSDVIINVGGGSIGGEDNVQADWKETDATSDAYIKNKPTTLAELGISEIYETRGRGSNSVTTLANLPVDKALVLASLSGATSISLSSAMNVGESITIVCTPSADFTQPLPTTGSYVSMDGDSLSVTAGNKFEINILCIASGSYSISCKVAV